MTIDTTKLRAAAEKATPGPWTLIASGHGSVVSVGDSTSDHSLADLCRDYRDDDNAAYIVAANPAAIIALLDRLAALERVAEAARDVCRAWPGDLSFGKPGTSIGDMRDAIANLDRTTETQP